MRSKFQKGEILYLKQSEYNPDGVPQSLVGVPVSFDRYTEDGACIVKMPGLTDFIKRYSRENWMDEDLLYVNSDEVERR